MWVARKFSNITMNDTQKHELLQTVNTKNNTTNVMCYIVYNFTCINCFQFADISAGARGNRGMSDEDACSLVLKALTFSEDLTTLFCFCFFFFFFFGCLQACFKWCSYSVLSYLAFLTTWSTKINNITGRLSVKITNLQTHVVCNVQEWRLHM